MSKSDVDELVGPFRQLESGTHIKFELFDEVPQNAVRLREGVILQVRVEVAPLKNGESTVQTLLDLAELQTYEAHPSKGACPTAETVPLEALKTVTVVVGREDEDLKVLQQLWGQHVPALAGRSIEDAPRIEEDLRAVTEDGKSTPVKMKDLLRDGNSTPFDSKSRYKGRKEKKSSSKVNSDGVEMYLSKRR